MSENTVRSAIGAALDHPFAEEAFALVDVIEANVRDGEPGGELHEVAAELTETLIEGPLASTQTLAVLWAVLGADGAAVENFGDFDPSASTLDRVRLDVWIVVERAVFAGLEAFARENASTCRHCGRSIILDGDRWVDPEATGDDSVWRETCDEHDTFEAEHEPEADQ